MARRWQRWPRPGTWPWCCCRRGGEPVLTVVTAGKAAPGVTTSTWALALSWPRPLLVADCDPAGADMTSGLLAGRARADRGLVSWSMAARRHVSGLRAAAMLAEHTVQLPERPEMWLVPG